MTLKLLQALQASGTVSDPARVVSLASIGNIWVAPKGGIFFNDLNADKNYDLWTCYGQSKLANIMFAKEFYRRLQQKNLPIISVALNPGMISETNLTRHGGLAYYSAFVSRVTANGKLNTLLACPNKNIAQGASTTLFCSLNPDIQAGEYYSDCKVETELINPVALDPVAADCIIGDWQAKARRNFVK